MSQWRYATTEHTIQQSSNITITSKISGSSGLVRRMLLTRKLTLLANLGLSTGIKWKKKRNSEHQTSKYNTHIESESIFSFFSLSIKKVSKCFHFFSTFKCSCLFLFFAVVPSRLLRRCGCFRLC